MSRNRPHRSRSHLTWRAITLDGAVPNSVRSAPVQNALSPSPRSSTLLTSGIVANGLHRFVQVVAHLHVVRVEHPWAVQRDLRNATVLYVKQ